MHITNHRQFCLINDPGSGGAVIGSVQFGPEMFSGAKQIDDVKKQAAEKPANWHHPQAPTVLRVIEGSHVIWVQNRGLAHSVTLNVGDEILFLDFEENRIVQAGSHPGHWSQQGSAGLFAHRFVLEVAPELSMLGFQPI